MIIYKDTVWKSYPVDLEPPEVFNPLNVKIFNFKKVFNKIAPSLNLDKHEVEMTVAK